MKHRILVTLTSISSRLNGLDRVLTSLLQQDFPKADYQIHLYLSHESYLLDTGCSDIPASLTRLIANNSRSLSLHYVNNTGPYRKFIPAAQFLYSDATSNLESTLFVTADDDTIYPTDWLRTLYEQYLLHQCVIAFRGRRMAFDQGSCRPYSEWSRTISENPSLLNVPTGKDGVLYAAKDVHPDALQIDTALHTAPHADDLWLKCHSLLLAVPSFIINLQLDKALPSVSQDVSQPSLYNAFNASNGNDIAINALNLYLQTRHNTSVYGLAYEVSSPQAIIQRSMARLFEQTMLS